jgi:hypothetical protein
LPEFDVDGVDEMDARFLSGIVAAAEDGVADELCGRNAKPFQDSRLEVGVNMVERQLEFREAKHDWVPLPRHGRRQGGGRSCREEVREQGSECHRQSIPAAQ